MQRKDGRSSFLGVSGVCLALLLGAHVGCGLSADLDQYGLDDAAGSAEATAGSGAQGPVDGDTQGAGDAGTRSTTDADEPGAVEPDPGGPRVSQHLVLNPQADAYVSQQDAKGKFGKETALLVAKSPDACETLISFEVPELLAPVERATLRLFATATANGRPVVYLAKEKWKEDDVTWDKRPKKKGEAIATLDQPRAGWVDFDVTPAVSASGAISFLLVSGSSGDVDFESREATHKPELVVVTGAPDDGVSGSGCDGGAQPMGVLGAPCCTMSEVACAGHAQKLVLICDPTHTWIALQTCEGDKLCSTSVGIEQGSCQEPVPDCFGRQPGAAYCEGRVAVACGPDLVSSVRTACDFACVDGKCRGNCVPGERTCEGGTPRVCTSNGTWQSEATCPYVCTGAGQCTGECVPGAKTCKGEVPLTCGESGQWIGDAACPAACVEGTCTLACVPGERQCNGQVPQTCMEGGQWIDEPPCAVGCSEGACVGE